MRTCFGQLHVWRSRCETWFAPKGFVEFAPGKLDFSPPPVEDAIGEPETQALPAEVGFRGVVDPNSTCRNYKRNCVPAEIALRVTLARGPKGASRGSGLRTTQGVVVATPGIGLATT